MDPFVRQRAAKEVVRAAMVAIALKLPGSSALLEYKAQHPAFLRRTARELLASILNEHFPLRGRVRQPLAAVPEFFLEVDNPEMFEAAARILSMTEPHREGQDIRPITSAPNIKLTGNVPVSEVGRVYDIHLRGDVEIMEFRVPLADSTALGNLSGVYNVRIANLPHLFARRGRSNLPIADRYTGVFHPLNAEVTQ